mmetsp:Transcript_15187/g.32648  ORF Transcript_15187/g.32648 Transcript_15187/m.32648 type:complete len:240 (-) Transcript_15187:1394-2113(-)
MFRQVSQVRIRKLAVHVRKNDKGRRSSLCLDDVLEFGSHPVYHRWPAPGHHFREPSVQQSRRNGPGPAVSGVQYRWQQLRDALAGQAADGDDRYVAQDRDSFLDLLPDVVGKIAGRVLGRHFQQIHLVGGNHQGPTLVQDGAAQRQLLSLHVQFLGVQHQDGNLGNLHGSQGIRNGHVLDGIVFCRALCELSYSGRVYQSNELLLLLLCFVLSVLLPPLVFPIPFDGNGIAGETGRWTR